MRAAAAVLGWRWAAWFWGAAVFSLVAAELARNLALLLWRLM